MIDRGFGGDPSPFAAEIMALACSRRGLYHTTVIGDFLKRLGKPRGNNAQASHYSEKATADDIRACFRLILGRYPNPEEWPGYSSRAGEDLKAVVSSFLQSPEFPRRGMLSSAQFQRYKIVEVNDVKVAIYPDDMDVGREVNKLVYEPNVTTLLKREIKPGMRVLDVGANCGYFTFLARKLVGDHGTVFAIEPHIANVRLLEIGRRANGFDEVHIIPVAAGENAGMAPLYVAHTNGVIGSMADGGDIMDTTLVCQMPLDAIVDKVDFVKIDVEGQELNALRGFSVGLENRPMIVSEFSPGMLGKAAGEEYLEFLLSRGYKIGVVSVDGSIASYHDKPTPIMQAHLASRVDHIDIFAVPAAWPG